MTAILLLLSLLLVQASADYGEYTFLCAHRWDYSELVGLHYVSGGAGLNEYDIAGCVTIIVIGRYFLANRLLLLLLLPTSSSADASSNTVPGQFISCFQKYLSEYSNRYYFLSLGDACFV